MSSDPSPTWSYIAVVGPIILLVAAVVIAVLPSPVILRNEN